MKHLFARILMNAAGGDSAGGGGSAAAVAPVVSTAAPVAPAVPAAPSAASTNEEPHWLKGRLEQAKSSVLRELGVENVEAAKAAIAAQKAADEATKTAAEKAAEYKAQLDATAQRANALDVTVKEHAGRLMMGLTPEQAVAVKAIAGDDAAAQLRAIGALQPTWAANRDAAAATAAAPATQAAPTVATPAASTAPAPSAPNGAVTSPANHREVYQQLRSTDPFAAARYAEQHPQAYGPKG